MPLLADYPWKLRYTPEDGNLVAGLYVPLLSCAERYDRLTGYFSATALALAARGIEGLALNNGSMRMVVGCTLGPEEVAAIEHGEALRSTIGRRLTAMPLEPCDDAAKRGLEILAWLVEQGRLEVKVAVPCDHQRRPLATTAIFHEKAGIVEDKTGQKVAFSGSLNETAAGWTQNFESLHVFTSWSEPARVAAEEEHFAKLWADKAKHAIVVDVPQAARDDLLRFLPDPGQLPAALVGVQPTPNPEPTPTEAVVEPPAPKAQPSELRRRAWAAIAAAPNHPLGGERVGEATSTVTPWPHQVRAFERMYRNWPPKLLIADEVGLGKSLQAGLVMRQAMLAGRAKRILLMAPKAVVKQWQIELREKLNLNWPIYDGQKLSWFPSPALRDQSERTVARGDWHKEPFLIVSSHLLRRAERQPEVLGADPWDLIILDEAHHARRRGAGSTQEGGPNALLRLMRALRARTQGLVLLTATPMQVHPIEVWDLLDLLGLPSEWSQSAFLSFFEELAKGNPSHEALDRMAALFQASERAFGPLEGITPESLGLASNLRAKKVVAALRDPATAPRRQFEADQRRAALALLKRSTPVARLISRHTRDLLRRYHKAGKLKTRIADRVVRDEFIHLSDAEREIYEAVEDYISSTYDAVAKHNASAQERSAVGFVMTIYRRRLASSFHALRCTLESHMASITDPSKAGALLTAGLDEDVDEDEADAPDEDEAEKLAKQALAIEEKSEIERLLNMIRRLPPDTKVETLRAQITALRGEGFPQVMVFTQFTDTMDLLRRQLASGMDGARIMCFSGRGGEIPSQDGTWRVISRDEVKRRFREGAADILLCTDAAAEGLNFQFCGALINYDSPWNPMRIEQRIGRIDRLGQRFERIGIVNLHYADTVEADVYIALRQRIGLFQSVVGGLQPILARMPSLIGARVLEGNGASAVEDIERAVDAAQATGGFDLDAMVETELEEPPRAFPALTLDELDDLLHSPALLPPEMQVRVLDGRSYGLLLPGRGELRVTTDPSFYDDHADATELWSPGNPIFPELTPTDPSVVIERLRDVLDEQ